MVCGETDDGQSGIYARKYFIKYRKRYGFKREFNIIFRNLLNKNFIALVGDPFYLSLSTLNRHHTIY